MALRSSFGAPTPIPILAKQCPPSSNSSEACSSALDGMQPTFRHVPPNVARLSTTAVLRPSCAARMAHTYPPGPVPMTIKCEVIAISLEQGDPGNIGSHDSPRYPEVRAKQTSKYTAAHR